MYQDKIEERMDVVRNLISLGRNAREEAKIKVRQPISKVILDGKNKSLINDLVELLKEELNVKEVVFEDNLEEYIKFIIKPNFKEVGKVLGSKMKEFQEILKSLPEKVCPFSPVRLRCSKISSQVHRRKKFGNWQKKQ